MARLIAAMIATLVAMTVAPSIGSTEQAAKKQKAEKAKPYKPAQNCLFRNSDGSCKGGQPR